MKKALCVVLWFMASAWAERLELMGSTGEGAGLGIHISDTLAFIVQGGAGLKIINVAHPENPTVVGSCKTAYKAAGLFVKDSLCFVADWDSGLTVVNVAHPENPYVVGRCPQLTPQANNVWVVDTIAVVTGLFSLFSNTWIVNVVDPKNPTPIGGYDKCDNDLFVRWPLAFVATGGNGLILDLSDPTKPVCLDSTIGAGGGVFVVDTILYTNWPIYNIKDPTHPKWLIDWPFENQEADSMGYFCHLFVSGHYAYITVSRDVYPGIPWYYGGIMVYDVSDPSKPKNTAKYRDYDRYYNDIFVVGSRVYAVTDRELRIFDHNTGIEEKEPVQKVVQAWLKVFPNPSNTQFTIHYALPEAGSVSLQIYDVAGRLVKGFDSGIRVHGVYTLHWDGRDDKGHRVSAGIYFLRLNISGKQAVTQKAVLVR